MTLRPIGLLKDAAGIEPATRWLKANCSTTELRIRVEQGGIRTREHTGVTCVSCFDRLHTCPLTRAHYEDRTRALR